MSRHFIPAGLRGEIVYKGLGGKQWEGMGGSPVPLSLSCSLAQAHCSFAGAAILGVGHENELSSFLSYKDFNCVCSSSPSQAVLGRQRIRLEL